MVARSGLSINRNDKSTAAQNGDALHGKMVFRPANQGKAAGKWARNLDTGVGVTENFCISSRPSSAALDADALLEKAARKTSLSDFGDDGFRKPLEFLLKSLREEARLNARGVFMMNRTVLRLLANRLLTEKAFVDNPEMKGTPIDRPLYVIGFPRTGTTLLHNLLACDPAACWLRLWEGLYPTPPPQSLEVDSRITKVEEWAAGFDKVAPRLASAHKLEPCGPEECLWLIEHTFIDLIFELRAHVPGYSEWLVDHEANTGVYQYYRRQLQMLGTHCRGDHWVFKAPRHLAGLAGLLAVFPDARIVQNPSRPVGRAALALQPVRNSARRGQ